MASTAAIEADGDEDAEDAKSTSQEVAELEFRWRLSFEYST
jgi:hypothetical protein